MSAGLGSAPALFAFQNCVKSAAAPAICGAACDVPVLYAWFGSKQLETEPQLPAREPLMTVPGAGMSGLRRPSAAGPRLELLRKSSILSAPVVPSSGRTFSEFATEITFFATFGRVRL